VKKTLTTSDYVFLWDKNLLTVIFLKEKEPNKIDLKVLNVETIGIMKENDNWVVVIITTEALKKLQGGISESLETVGFSFKDKDTAMSIQNFLINYLIGEK
jgi:hypothetical protein